jgi:hypothetical protein
MAMKRILFLIIALFFTADTLSGAELLKVSRVPSKDLIQLYFYFDSPPQFSTTDHKKRIDIVFKNADTADGFELFPADDKIVKILTRRTKDSLILSLFFRYTPQKYKLSPNANNSVVFEVLLGNEYSSSYKDLAKRLQGLTVVERNTPDFSNPYVASPYRSDWTSFFSNYEGPISIDIPVSFTPPPFPVMALLPPNLLANAELLTDEMKEQAAVEGWDMLSTLILEKLEQEKDPESQKLLALTYGEALLRGGDFEGAFKQLYLLRQEYPEELLGTFANYLLIWLRAKYEDPYLAEYEYRKLAPEISDNSPLAPYFLLSQIETSLATKEYEHMNELLQVDTIALPSEVQERVTIREADYWYSIKQPIKAYAAYKLLENSTLLQTQPYSYGGYCSTLYDQKYFKSASVSYRNLKVMLSDDHVIGLVAYRENMAKLKFSKESELIDDFSSIENSYQKTEAGYLGDRNWLDNGLLNYMAIAEEAAKRSIREEALFKAILLHSFRYDNGTAVTMLENYLREFQTGNVRDSAQALLIDILPKEIKRLVDDGEYLAALVLAKKNKDLFQKNWINSNFLVDIARAYHNVGIFNEAQKLYLYLIEISTVDEREKFYLPMIKATFDYGNFSLVEDYASQYTYNYPDGKDSNAILLFRVRALIADSRLNEALLALPLTLPEDGSFHEVAARLYFRTSKYSETISTLESFRTMGNSLTEQEIYLLAESYHQEEEFDKAEVEFAKLSEDNNFYHQSLYRQAEYARMKGEEKKALTFLEKIVETEKNSKWKEYAERDLQYESKKNRY